MTDKWNARKKTERKADRSVNDILNDIKAVSKANITAMSTTVSIFGEGMTDEILEKFKIRMCDWMLVLAVAEGKLTASDTINNQTAIREAFMKDIEEVLNDKDGE